MGIGGRWSADGNPALSVRTRLRNYPKSCGLKQRAGKGGKEAAKGSGCWPGGWERGRPCGPGRRWGVRGDGHGSLQRGPAAPGGCVSLPSTPFPGQKGSGASACELEMPLTSAHPCGEGPAGSQAGVPARIHAITAILAHSQYFLLLFLLGQNSGYSGIQIPLSPAVSGSSWPSSCSHKSCAQPHSTPHYPSSSQGVSSGCHGCWGTDFQAISHRLNGINR